VLVDRLWPRGLSKAKAQLDRWDREVAPSAQLRRAWHAEPEGHSPEGFRAFARDYRRELATDEGSAALEELIALAREHSPLTLLFGAKDEEINHAAVLREALLDRLSR
jgi:uncharacterized protein YeaO (DUF488 family)